MVNLISGSEVNSRSQIFLNINYITSIKIVGNCTIVSLVDGTSAYVSFEELEKIRLKFSYT